MHVKPRSLAALLLAAVTTAAIAADPQPIRFDFTGSIAAGNKPVSTSAAYSKELGYGFEGTSGLKSGDACLTSDKPFFFSTDVPVEGNYRVTITFGDKAAASDTTVKAELRRLMLEHVHTDAGQQVKKSFIVNVRVPQFPGGSVRLKGQREAVEEAWAWDPRITLEFNNKRPAIAAIEIVKVDVPTVYILGDSTSCDQGKEPYASWGQMFTVFFKDTVGIANHGESGESVGAANGAKRFDKILSLLKPGDTFITQFGHNDMKGVSADLYAEGLKKWVEQVKAKGATAIIVTPVSRHSYRDGKFYNSHINERGDFPEAAKRAAKESGAHLIDLTEMSRVMYEAMGEKPSLELFEHQNGKYDLTHHSPYGAYEIAKCVVEGIRAAKLDLANQIVDGYIPFNPAKPDAEADFKVPPTPLTTTEKPFGN